MSIGDQIKQALKKARLEKDEPTKNVIGMLKSKLMNELKSGKGREESDELWLEVMAAYAKEVGKSIEKFQEIGERGVEALAEANFELEFCQKFLPTKLSEDETEQLVRKVATDNEISDPKMVGKLMGLIMKSHKGQVDGNLVRQVAQRVLSE